jgi:hypothetical protein
MSEMMENAERYKKEKFVEIRNFPQSVLLRNKHGTVPALKATQGNWKLR